MRAYASNVVLCLAAIIAVNVIVDVSGMATYDLIVDLTRRQRQDSLIVSAELFDQRAWLEARLLGPGGCPELLVLGSSTVGAWQALFTPGRRLLNGWLTGPTIEDLEATTELLRRAHCVPEHIVLGVDPWLMNAKVTNFRWMSLLDEYLAYHGDRSSLGRYAALATQTWQRFKERLSYEATRESLAVLADRLRAGKIVSVRPRLVERSEADFCAERPAPSYVRSYDGHFFHCPEWLLSEPDVREIARHYVERNTHGMRDFAEVAPSRIAALTRVLSIVRARGSMVTLYAPPYHPIAYAELLAEPRIRAALEQLDLQLQGVAERTGVDVMSLRDPGSIPCGAGEFEDSHHAAPSCVRKVAARLRR
jgi:hypothetical protein